MTNRQKFIDEIENLLKESHYEILSDEALAYFEELKSGKASQYVEFCPGQPFRHSRQRS